MFNVGNRFTEHNNMTITVYLGNIKHTLVQEYVECINPRIREV